MKKLSVMKKLSAAAVLAMLAASPSFAAGAGKARTSKAATAGTAGNSKAVAPAADPYAVIVGNKYLGRDPDPNVRLLMRRMGDPADWVTSD